MTLTVGGDALTRLLTYSVGDYVWVRFGETRGVQLARVVDPHPASYYGVAEWFQVLVWKVKARRWAELPTERRIVRALTPTEVRKQRDLGIIPEAGR